MGVYLVAIFFGIPCLLFIIFTYTPKGKEWKKMNGLL